MLGADDYITKPFGARELQRALWLFCAAIALLSLLRHAPLFMRTKGYALITPHGGSRSYPQACASTPTEYRLLITMAEKYQSRFDA